MTSHDYYKILGVDRNATTEEIKGAYRRMVRKYHPDRNKRSDATARFREVQEAYEVLGDPLKRRRYDQQGREAYSGFGGRYGAGRERTGGGFDFREAGFDGFDFQRSFRQGSFGDIFGEIFRSSHHARPRSSRGEDIQYRMEIPLEEAAEGVDSVINVNGQKIAVKIPPGVGTGSRVRVAGQGASGFDGGSRGDLYILIRVKDHDIFRREGDDIFCTVPISFAEAALGANIKVPTLKGETVMKIPPGTQGGQRFRLKSMGIPRLKGRGRGDQYVIVTIKVPRDLNSRATEMLKEFEQLAEESDAQYTA
ncbi:MAG: DnaJ domain-containing protein [Deltaproteobacteria bacterium]|nr:DnaJ domain-containing protein [Deltaproteobacteria bacterium]MBW2307111.1 DnaJ domain-containing protein [Deltaproteobacteria bacterium]